MNPAVKPGGPGSEVEAAQLPLFRWPAAPPRRRPVRVYVAELGGRWTVAQGAHGWRTRMLSGPVRLPLRRRFVQVRIAWGRPC